MKTLFIITALIFSLTLPASGLTKKESAAKDYLDRMVFAGNYDTAVSWLEKHPDILDVKAELKEIIRVIKLEMESVKAEANDLGQDKELRSTGEAMMVDPEDRTEQREELGRRFQELNQSLRRAEDYLESL